ncbi:MAG: hypothetical protein WBY75_12050 [Terracidiphilus sp.]
MIQNPKDQYCWTRVSISIGVGLFLLALALSAVIVPQLVYLHLLQALIYLAVLVLTQRNNAWGYGIGVIVPTAWNCLNLFVTHLFQKGAVQVWSLIHSGQFWFLLRTGQVSRPDTLTVMIGGAAHVLIIVACGAGFLHLRPRGRQWGQFFGGGVLALAYFALIIAIAAPR